jgi:SPP1 family predicted phage head-tail adaptor
MLIKCTAGELTQRIRIQAPGTTRDEYGEVIAGWTDLPGAGVNDELYGRVSDISGREYLAAAATQNLTTTGITIYFRPDIKPNMQVIDFTDPANLDTYNIIAPLRGEPWMMLMCTRNG